MVINFNNLSIQGAAYIPLQNENNVSEVPQAEIPLQAGATGIDYISDIPLEILIRILGFAFEADLDYGGSLNMRLLQCVNRIFCDSIRPLLTSGENFGIAAQQKLCELKIVNFTSPSKYSENISTIKELLEGIKHLKIDYYKYSMGSYYFFGRGSDIQKLLTFLRAIAELDNIKTSDISIKNTDRHDSLRVLDAIINIIEAYPENMKINLCLEDDGFESTDMEILGPELRRNVYKLDLTRNYIGNDGLRILAPFIGNTSISKLILDCIQITLDGLRHLIGNLPENIEAISLAGNRLDENAVPIIGEILTINVKRLNLSENNIKGSGAINLLNLLQDKNVKKLFLRKNNIRSDAFGNFIEPLQNTGLKYFDLMNNGTVIKHYSSNNEITVKIGGEMVVREFTNRNQESISVPRAEKKRAITPINL